MANNDNDNEYLLTKQKQAITTITESSYTTIYYKEGFYGKMKYGKANFNNQLVIKKKNKQQQSSRIG